MWGTRPWQLRFWVNFFPLGKPFRRAIREELNSLVSETTTALCKKIVQKFRKIVSKSCFNFTFLTILACQAPLVDNKSTVQIWRNILESSEIYNFWWKFLPGLAWMFVSPTIWQDLLSHCFQALLHTLIKHSITVAWPFFTFLGLEDHPKMIDFCLRITTWITLSRLN